MKTIVFLWFAFGQSVVQAGLARTTLNAYTQGGKSLQTGTPLAYTPLKITVSIVNQYECPTSISFGLNDNGFSIGEETSLKQGMHNSLNVYNSLYYNYSQLIDGGNTNVLLQNIAINWSSDAWQLRNELLAHSPYLSEEAIRKTAEDGILPDAMLMEICLANPDVFRNERLIDFLAAEIPNPLPAYDIEILKTAWANSNPRSVLENALATQQSTLTQHFNRLASTWLQDSLQNHTDSLIVYLALMPNISSRYILADIYYEKGENSLAWQTLQNITTQFRLTDAQVAEHVQVENFLSLKIAVRNDYRNLSQLTEEEKTSLISIRDASDKGAGIKANNTLCFHYSICKDYSAILPEITAQQRKTNSSIVMDDALLNAYPNPAAEWITFEYHRNDISPATIEVTDITGRLIQHFPISNVQGAILWDIREISNGIYLYKLIREGHPSPVGKIVVQH